MNSIHTTQSTRQPTKWISCLFLRPHIRFRIVKFISIFYNPCLTIFINAFIICLLLFDIINILLMMYIQFAAKV
jgi:hypothetical protein